MRSLLFLCLWVTVAAADPGEHDGLHFRVAVGSGYVTDDVTGVPVSTEKVTVGLSVRKMPEPYVAELSAGTLVALLTTLSARIRPYCPVVVVG